MVQNISLDLEEGEFFCLLGPSGCGKSTLLRLIGGYLPPDRGRVWIRDQDMTNEPPERRRAGMVFQNYALFPHLSALDNIAFSLRVRDVAPAARLAKAQEMLEWVGLTEQEGRRRPAQLSGGQQQRVALARALAFDPEILMLDEPFANLDRLLRERLRDGLKNIQRRVRTTTILVTHDREEALMLGDRIAVMNRGRLLQIGAPEEVYRKPRNTTVARFLGHRNLFRIQRVEDNRIEIDGSAILPLPAGGAATGDFLLLWPERLRVHRTQNAGALAVTVSQIRFAGGHRVVTTKMPSGSALEVQMGADAPSLAEDEALWIEVPCEAMMVLPGDDDGQSSAGDADE